MQSALFFKKLQELSEINLLCIEAHMEFIEVLHIKHNCLLRA